MVCRMNIYQERFKKKMSCPKLVFSCFFLNLLASVGVYIVMVCRWTDHILARNPLLEVEADPS